MHPLIRLNQTICVTANRASRRCDWSSTSRPRLTFFSNSSTRAGPCGPQSYDSGPERRSSEPTPRSSHTYVYSVVFATASCFFFQQVPLNEYSPVHTIVSWTPSPRAVTVICNRDLCCLNPFVSPTRKQRHQQPTLTSGHDGISKVTDVTALSSNNGSRVCS